LAVILLKESINAFQLVGMGLIFTAIWLVSGQASFFQPFRLDAIFNRSRKLQEG
jgi:hypothetical protein